MAVVEAELLADQISYVDLYRRWEAGNWSVYDLDFSQDQVDWNSTFDDTLRRAAIWNYSMFFYGEDSVAENLAPFIDAAPTDEQKYFITTHQVDEARHAVFFARFFDEVMGMGSSWSSSLSTVTPSLTWGFSKIFTHLDKVVDELRRDRSAPQLAKAVMMYVFVVEATLAQTGQHFIQDYLDEMGVMPGFSEGMGHVSRDEQRHIAFGVKLMADLHRKDPEVVYALSELMFEIAPWMPTVFVPPNWDMSYIEPFGATLEDLATRGVTSFEAKMRAAGVPLDDLFGGYPLPAGLTNREKAQRSLAMARAGLLGHDGSQIDTSGMAVEYMFEGIAGSINKRHGFKRPTSIQWSFTDHEPWHIVVDGPQATAHRGRAKRPDVRIRVKMSDFADVFSTRRDPSELVRRGKMLALGNPFLVAKLPGLLAAPARPGS